MASQHEAAFPSFADFMDSIASARHEDFVRRSVAGTTSAEEFSAMAHYIRDLYAGIEVTHSFLDDNGQVFDCIPIGSQPALRGNSSLPPAAPDPPATAGQHDAGQSLPIQPQLRSDRLDRFGHSMSCSPGTIAMRRITLEEMARRGSVRNFHQKYPQGMSPRHRPSGPDDSRQYATAVQTVDNLGGHSYVNVWGPRVTGPDAFSLSQQWYTGGSPQQNIECGYQVFPGKYGTTQPVLFIYWTADDYRTTGCYNLECTAFVQTNSSWVLGGTLAPVSVPGGAQTELDVAWYLSGGNWWLYLNDIAVGYYPASLFGNGQLATNAQEIEYGGETWVQNSATWPPMGSGQFAAGGWQIAAYHRDIQYVATDNTPQFAKLTGVQTAPSCYTALANSGPQPWNEYLFYGGPGGTTCP
ncbi:neprosin family prolyl endopeptidase [Kitasatospora sp. NPDC004669]|uniref:neprosin family prolyl endopeptidase n=1 Tax=Kitasatospora sp. NPDC004669 TaxID=3154555 RepID=UPI00339DB0B8